MQQKNAGQGRSKRERAAFLKKRAATGPGLVDALQGLRQLRAPYDDILKSIVGETLGTYPAIPGKPIVEIGAGTGQLRRWLPADVRDQVIHTDPADQALDLLRREAPDARTAVAPAQRLPFTDGACGGALGLCVFDTLHTAAVEDAAVAELARVLAPGAWFVHFLDMATLLDRPFQEFNAHGVVPVPNVFGDPDDHPWPLDIVLFEREWLRQILHFALQIEHPLVTMFGPYFGAFLLQPFDLGEAILRFKSIATNSAVQHALASQIASLFQLAVQQGHPARSAIPFHSGQYLSAVMETAFAKSGLFRTAFFDIVARSGWRPVAHGQTERYRSLCLGHERIRNDNPKRLLAASSRQDRASYDTRTDRVLIEAGVFVFVTQRIVSEGT